MIAIKDVKVYVSPFAVISIMTLHFSHSSKWPDPFKDEVTYVDNPIESGFPGHWLPLSIIKKIMEMRVLTLASEAITNTQKNIKLKLHATSKRVKGRIISKNISTNATQNKKTTSLILSSHVKSKDTDEVSTADNSVSESETPVTTPLLTPPEAKQEVLSKSIPTTVTEDVLIALTTQPSSITEGTSTIQIPTTVPIEPLTPTVTKTLLLTTTKTMTKLSTGIETTEPLTTTTTTSTTTEPPTTTKPTTTTTSTTTIPKTVTTTSTTTTMSATTIPTTVTTMSTTTTTTTETGDPFY